MSAQTRQRILMACEKLIQTLGLARVTTKQIAKETGLSEGALYRHFNHKDDLFLAVFEKQLGLLASVLSEYVAGKGEVEDNLRQICLAILSYYEQLLPLTASYFADTELLARFREVLQKSGGATTPPLSGFKLYRGRAAPQTYRASITGFEHYDLLARPGLSICLLATAYKPGSIWSNRPTVCRQSDTGSCSKYCAV